MLDFSCLRKSTTVKWVHNQYVFQVGPWFTFCSTRDCKCLVFLPDGGVTTDINFVINRVRAAVSRSDHPPRANQRAGTVPANGHEPRPARSSFLCVTFFHPCMICRKGVVLEIFLNRKMEMTEYSPVPTLATRFGNV